MRCNIRSAILVAITLIQLAAPHVAKADEYLKPSWDNMARVLARYSALDFSDEKILEEYAIVTECSLYEYFYNDDFRWNQVLQAVKASLNQQSITYPTTFFYDVDLQLGRYDFKNKLFRFTEKSQVYNVNSFVLFQTQPRACATERHIVHIPATFHAVVNEPVYIPGLPLSQKDSEILLDLMKQDGNVSRIVKARFKMHITYISKLHRFSDKESQKYYYAQNESDPRDSVRVEAHLDTVQFFEDSAATKLIYTYNP